MQESLKQFLKYIKTRESSFSVMAGFALVLVVVIFLVWLGRSKTTVSEMGVAPETPVVDQLPVMLELVTENGQQVPTGLPVVYIVQAGDSSWKIAEAFYGTGHNYVDIEAANQLQPDQMLEIGQELLIPRVPVRQLVEQVVSSSETTEANVDNNLPELDQNLSHPANYVVQPGDCLWTIADQQLGDPYRWTQIYELNQAMIGVNPDLIYPNSSLRLPQ